MKQARHMVRCNLRPVLAVSVSALVVAGALLQGAGVNAASVRQPHHAKQLVIAFLRPAPDPYYQDGQRGAVLAAPFLGAKVETYFSNASQQQELANVEDAISKHVDGIEMYAVSLSAEKSDIAKANAAHIPIFLLYGYDKSELPHVAGFLQANLVPYGEQIGAWMAQHLKSGKVAIITGLLGRGDAEAYAAGFKAGLAKNPKDTVIAQLPGNWLRETAYTAAQDLITAHPDLKGLYVENEDMAIGAIRALKQAHKEGQVVVVSANGAPYGLDAIRAGEIQASNSDSPALEAVMGMRVLVGVIHHQVQPGHLYYAITKFITKANVDQANPWLPSSAVVKTWVTKMPLIKPVPANKVP